MAMLRDHVGGESQQVEVQLLGPVRVVCHGRALPLGGLQARSVLAVLMLHSGRVVPRRVIVGNAWRGDPPQSAQDLVTHYVSRLRSALSPVSEQICLEAVRPGFRARLAADLVDVNRFTALVRQTRQDHAAGEDEWAIAHLERAVALWRGGSLALEDVEADWLRAQAVTLQDQRCEALEQLAALYCGVGRSAHAVRLLREEAPRYPQRDQMIALLVQALADTGQGAVAVEVADRAHDALDEAGLPVGPLLRQARREAQRPRPSLNVPSPLRQLPPDTSALIGRERELVELLQLGDTTGCTPSGGVVISAIDGMAGIGKTALAVHAGHRLAARFPDGQLFLDLHGFTPGHTPRGAADLLADVLRTLGVPPQQLPQDLDARAALYRDRLSGKRILVVLDNARTEEQVRPLLPGHPGCLVLVTSRRRLKALDEAWVLSLDVLPLPHAVALLRSVAGPGRIPAADPSLEEIAQLCGLLPLALRIAAALLRHRPSWTLAHLTGRLRDGRPALAGFDDGDRDLGAVFDLSYTALPADQQFLFRRLGLYPGGDIDSYAAAALVDTDPDTADGLLQRLVDHNLLAESPPGRYRIHDLIRAHAHALAMARETETERDSVVNRLLDYYAHTAQSASIPLARFPRSAPVGPAPSHAPVLTNPRAAHAWLRAEHLNLEAAHAHARAHARESHAVALALGLAESLRTDGLWPRALELHQATALSAERLGNPGAQATALTELGRVEYLMGRYLKASDTHLRALEIVRGIDDRLGQATVLNDLGRVHQAIGDLPAAGGCHLQALDIFREIGNRLGQATALTELGRVRRLTGDLSAAADTQNQALDIYREIGNRGGEAWALNHYAATMAAIGNAMQALAFYRDALRMNRALGKPDDMAVSLEGIGECLFRGRDKKSGIRSLREALDVFEQLGMHTDAKRVRARLADDIAPENRTAEYGPAECGPTVALRR